MRLGKKLIYLAQTGLFDEWAHNVQIMKMCEAFSENGRDVTLVVPKRKSFSKIGVFEHFNIKPIFKIVSVPYLDFFVGSSSPIWYWVRFISFLISARVYLFTQPYDVLYTRELYVAPFFRNVFIERHSFSKTVTKIQMFIFKISGGLIVLTSFIKSRIVGLGINSNKIFIAPDAVRLEDFNMGISRDNIRNKLGISKNINLLGYVGTLKTMGMEKGVAAAIDALLSLPSSYMLYVVGGEYGDVEYYKKYALDKNLDSRVIFTGRVPHKDIPLHIAVCDVVVAPFPENEHYNYYMSPLKIFEYMASRRPMVVTDLPSLREVLVDGKTALFVPPGDSRALANAVERLTKDSQLANQLSENAYKEVVEKYTWKKRAENILQFISSKNQ